ncbi:MAG: hypothetical protein E7614_04965 [Ruminococcaceae bacterium]|nr:hypothetical protein [Oscillospiraceae bacterium]
MSIFFKKIKRIIKNLSKSFKADCNFSFYFSVLNFLGEFFRIIKIKSLSLKLSNISNNWISDYLKKNLNSIIEKHSANYTIGEFQINAPIWICWWDGEANAPSLVRQCIKSTRKNAGNHPVYFIDKDSYSDFLEIPEYILNKVKNKIIGLANFSDYLRFSLLAKYGGVWLDSTVFTASAIPESYFELPLFTCKSKTIECGYVSKMRWTSFVIGGWKDNALFNFFKEAWEFYWINHNVAIDYLLVDHLINIFYTENTNVRELMDNIPINNIHRDDLQAAMNANISKNKFHKILNNDTILYKLSWRETYSSKTPDGEQSIYDFFIKSDLSSLCL